MSTENAGDGSKFEMPKQWKGVTPVKVGAWLESVRHNVEMISSQVIGDLGEAAKNSSMVATYMYEANRSLETFLWRASQAYGVAASQLTKAGVEKAAQAAIDAGRVVGLDKKD